MCVSFLFYSCCARLCSVVFVLGASLSSVVPLCAFFLAVISLLLPPPPPIPPTILDPQPYLTPPRTAPHYSPLAVLPAIRDP